VDSLTGASRAPVRIIYRSVGTSNAPREERGHSCPPLLIAAPLPLLDVTEEVDDLVETYILNKVMPVDAAGDALHLALATVHRCDILVSWNCRHIANANKTSHIRKVNGRLGYETPVLITPLELLNQKP
jgi:hypothetical protein